MSLYNNDNHNNYHNNNHNTLDLKASFKSRDTKDTTLNDKMCVCVCVCVCMCVSAVVRMLVYISCGCFPLRMKVLLTDRSIQVDPREFDCPLQGADLFHQS